MCSNRLLKMSNRGFSCVQIGYSKSTTPVAVRTSAALRTAHSASLPVLRALRRPELVLQRRGCSSSSSSAKWLPAARLGGGGLERLALAASMKGQPRPGTWKWGFTRVT